MSAILVYTSDIDKGAGMDVAMVGLGNLGGRMAVRLRDAGHAMVGHDLRPGRAADLGLEPAADLAAACRAPVVLLSLPSDAAIDAVVLAPDGVRAHAAPGTVVVDLSTASPARTRERHAALAESGIELLDAGVSGGPRAAEAGTLTLMAGGSAAALDAVRPVLLGLGERLFHVGGPGTGHAAKAVNNFLNAANLAATAEAMVVGTKAGLDPVQLLEIVNASSGRNWATEHRFPSILRGDYLEGGLSNALMAKDLDVYLDLAAGTRAPTLVGATCRSVFAVAMATGYADRVSNTVVDALGDLAGGVRVQPGGPAGEGG